MDIGYRVKCTGSLCPAEKSGLAGKGEWISCEMHWESVTGSTKNRDLAENG